MAENPGFAPEWATPPGETIVDILRDRGISKKKFAAQLGVAPEQIELLLNGATAITGQIADSLAGAIGASASFWLKREADYRDSLARRSRYSDGVDAKLWSRTLPSADISRFGWLDLSQKASQNPATYLQFFGVSTPADWKEAYADVLDMTRFRTSPTFQSDPVAVVTWIRQGELRSADIECGKWNPDGFRDELSHIRSLTREKEPRVFLAELQKRCAMHGVAVVIVRAPTKCHASGATRIMARGRRLVLLSFRYLSDDHFWFTFFHEAGHLLLHRDSALFLDGEHMLSSKQEDEANEFAADFLVPSTEREALSTLPADDKSIIRFARRLGVSPGIVVGQLQHYGYVKRNHFNYLKRRFTWQEQ